MRTLLAATVLAVVAGTSAATAAPPAGSAESVEAVASAESATSARVAPAPGSAGIGDPYFPVDGNGGYDVRHYDIHDRLDPRRERLTGWTTILATATQDLTRLNLDLLLTVDKVLVDGAPARFTRPTAHELQVTPARMIPRGDRFRVRVHYHGRPSRIGWRGERNWFQGGGEAIAINEPHIAPWWFPSNDHPSDKASFDISITAPLGREVLSNGVLVTRTGTGDWRTWHWRMPSPMATYLAFFAVGDYVVERGTTNGLPWTIAVSRQLDAERRTRALALMRTTPGVVRWLETQLGEYPFEATGGVTTGIPSVWFALENQSRPTYPYVGGRGHISLVVHEQAHQWFGDDVAVRRWRDIWLNEGFATFMEVRYAETHGGRRAQRWLLDTWSSRPADSWFWDVPIGNPGPDSLFDVAVYERGAMAVQALRHRIGEQDFWTLVRTWLEQRRRGTGSVAQFRALAESVSGEELDGFFTAWLVSDTRPAKTEANGLLP